MTVGQEREAPLAFGITPSPVAEGYHLPLTQGYKYHLVRNGESRHNAEPPPSSPDLKLLPNLQFF